MSDRAKLVEALAVWLYRPDGVVTWEGESEDMKEQYRRHARKFVETHADLLSEEGKWEAEGITVAISTETIESWSEGQKNRVLDAFAELKRALSPTGSETDA